MRQIIMEFLQGRPELTSLIPAARWFEGGSIEDTPIRPFAVVRVGGTFRGIGAVNKRRLEIHFHDERGSFTLIDTVLLRTRDALAGAVHLKRTGSSAEVLQVDWVSDSPDLFDTEHKTNIRSSQYDLVGKGA